MNQVKEFPMDQNVDPFRRNKGLEKVYEIQSKDLEFPDDDKTPAKFSKDFCPSFCQMQQTRMKPKN